MQTGLRQIGDAVEDVGEPQACESASFCLAVRISVYITGQLLIHPSGLPSEYEEFYYRAYDSRLECIQCGKSLGRRAPW